MNFPMSKCNFAVNLLSWIWVIVLFCCELKRLFVWHSVGRNIVSCTCAFVLFSLSCVFSPLIVSFHHFSFACFETNRWFSTIFFCLFVHNLAVNLKLVFFFGTKARFSVEKISQTNVWVALVNGQKFMRDDDSDDDDQTKCWNYYSTICSCN